MYSLLRTCLGQPYSSIHCRFELFSQALDKLEPISIGWIAFTFCQLMYICLHSRNLIVKLTYFVGWLLGDSLNAWYHCICILTCFIGLISLRRSFFQYMYFMIWPIPSCGIFFYISLAWGISCQGCKLICSWIRLQDHSGHTVVFGLICKRVITLCVACI